MITESQWSTIRALVAWLDDENGRSEHEVAMRFLKIAEEAGEAAAAYIGMQGQNPRKGITHTADDVAAELCDVIVTAAVTLTMISGDPEAVFATKLAKIAARVGVQTEPDDADLGPLAVQCLASQTVNLPRGGVR